MVLLEAYSGDDGSSTPAMVPNGGASTGI